jgi:hypothetical protein
MKHIAVVTATPPSVNPGMLACEATALAFIRRSGLLPECTFFRVRRLDDVLRHVDPPTRAAINAACDVGIQFTLLEDASQLEHMVPVFWGDFLHMRAYIRAVSAGDDLTYSSLVNLLLLANSPTLQRRSISYGTSVLFNSTADYAAVGYGDAVEAFFANAFHVQMRDAISAAVVSGMRHAPENCFGIDPAQLLALDAYESAVIGDPGGNSDADRKDRAVVFFARGKHDWQRLEPFLEQLTNAIGIRPEWIPWGDPHSFPFAEHSSLHSTMPHIPLTAGVSRLGSLLRAIRESRCVITDTYHLGVISWAIGVPAIVIPGDYHDGELQPKTANVRVRNDKRKVIMSQDRLLDFYLEPYLIASPQCWTAVIARLAEAVHAAVTVEDFRKRLASKAAASEAALVTAINTARTA